ncbi:DUF7172 family protein [Rhodococcus koreensis]
MVNVCVDGNLRVVGGVLDIQAWVSRRLVHTHNPTVTNDATFTAQSILPGLNHIDATTSWTNTGPEAVDALFEVVRSRRQIRTSQPNLTFFRDRATAAVDQAADTPDLMSVFDSEMGGGFDRDTAAGTTPKAGTLWMWKGISTYTVGRFTVPAGSVLNLRYRCAHYSPSPFANNANNNSAQYRAFATGARLQVWATPVADLGSV